MRINVQIVRIATLPEGFTELPDNLRFHKLVRTPKPWKGTTKQLFVKPVYSVHPLQGSHVQAFLAGYMCLWPIQTGREFHAAGEG